MTRRDPSTGRRPGDDGASLVPGDVIDDRYRVVARIGRGGMGEVWRVDDLQLGQEVALKFLPPELAEDSDARRRFLDEVRVARQVSHPNVCRVHDVGGTDDAPYLTMEFVAGEDLASLLRRIGRLPEDKAVELASQVCAGLAAAHDQGIVHRDLKPANVLIDGDGVARIADFGLSAVAADMTAEDARVGTPRYMAPEQLRGEEVTTRSDIFSLGLVLFELFTGKEAFRARTLDELMRAHSESRPDARSIVAQLDPRIDALLRRCLAPEPSRRPASPREVIAALPGGDPLAAALAAGETPSPELIASAGGGGALNVRTAVALVALAAGIVLFLGWSDAERRLVRIVDPELAPQVLAQRALEVTRLAGIYDEDERPTDSVGTYTERVRNAFARTEGPWHERWDDLRHPWSESLRYWWRAADAALNPEWSAGEVRWNDPPATGPGHVRVILAHDGRLLSFGAEPHTEDAEVAATDGGRPDWGPLFAAAELDLGALEDSDVDFLSPSDNDAKRVLIGPAPDLEGATVTVRTASLGSRPVYFDVSVELEGEGDDSGRPPKSFLRDLQKITEELLGILAIVGGLWFGALNIRRGQGDLRGAVRVALAVIVASTIAWILRGHHASGFFPGFFDGVPDWLFLASLTGFLYVALEPTVRRTSPWTLVSWQRLLAGRVRDPLVARDALLGLVGGLGMCALIAGNWVTIAALGDARARPHTSTSSTFGSSAYQLGDFAIAVLQGSTFALLLPFLFTLAYKLLRRRSFAYVALGLIALARMPYSVISSMPWIDFSFRALQATLIVGLFHKGGIVALLGAFIALFTVPNIPACLELAPWYSGAWRQTATIVLALILACAWRATRGSSTTA